MDFTAPLRRSLLVTTVVALGAGTTVFFLDNWFQDDFLAALGIVRPLGDAIGAMLIVAAAPLAQRLLSRFFIREQVSEPSATLDELALSARRMLAVGEEVCNELRSVPRYTGVLRDQLANVIRQTEQAASEIAGRLQAIDGVLGRLNDFVAASSAASALPVERSAQSIAQLDARCEEVLRHHATAIDTVRDRSAELASMFMDAMASMQFQDLTRQQIEHIAQALARLDDHLAGLAERLAQTGNPDRNYVPLAEQLDQLYAQYVMDSQRSAHKHSLRQPNARTGGGPAVELF